MVYASQLDKIYGEREAQTLRACFRNLVVLGGSKTDPKTYEDMSRGLESMNSKEINIVKRQAFSIPISIKVKNESESAS